VVDVGGGGGAARGPWPGLELGERLRCVAGR